MTLCIMTFQYNNTQHNVIWFKDTNHNVIQNDNQQDDISAL